MSTNSKLIVPVLALVICAGAMVGIGYAALSSDYTVTGDSIDAGEFKVTVNDSNGTGVAATFDVDMNLEAHTVQNGSSSPTTTYKVFDNDQSSQVYTLLSGQKVTITDTTHLNYVSYTVTVDLYKGSVASGNELSIGSVAPVVSFSGVQGTSNGNSFTTAGTATDGLTFSVTMDFSNVELSTEEVAAAFGTVGTTVELPIVAVVTVQGNLAGTA